jgi:hypothetical protein
LIVALRMKTCWLGAEKRGSFNRRNRLSPPAGGRNLCPFCRYGDRIACGRTRLKLAAHGLD